MRAPAKCLSALACLALATVGCARYGAEGAALALLLGGAPGAPELLSFGIVSPAADGTLSGSNVSVTVPIGSSLTALAARFTHTGAYVTVNGVMQTSGVTANDFTNPITYRVWSLAETWTDYTVAVSLGAAVTSTLTVTSAVSLDASTVRVSYSTPPDPALAGDPANYLISDAPAGGACSDNSNFTGGTQSADFVISSVSGSGAVYDLALSAPQTNGKGYTAIVNRSVVATSGGTFTTCPNNADFVGDEQLKVVSAACVDANRIVLRFSKPVFTGLNAARSAECNSATQCSSRYRLTGATSPGSITNAVVLNGAVCNGLAADSASVCLTHAGTQGGGVYAVSVANGIDGDGFDNVGQFAPADSIRNLTDTQNVQSSPNDRASFTGCGATPATVDDGPIAGDPFADSSAFGYLFRYGSQLYVGPNSGGNGAARFNPDGTSPQNLTFSIAKDTSGASVSSNTAATRDGGVAVPPFVTVGRTGCTSNTANFSTGCGPDNENGRGLFTSGTLGGTEYLFLTAARSGGNNDYIYYTSDLDGTLNFNYLDLSDFYDNCVSSSIGNNRGTESLHVSNDRLYTSSPGNGTLRPYTTYISSLTGELVCGTHGDYLYFARMTGVGYSSVLAPNLADRTGGVWHTFNNRLYFANSGSITNSAVNCNVGSAYSAGVCEQTGGLARATVAAPGRCTGNDACGDWTNNTPSDVRFRSRFSIVLPALADLTPADQPIPNFETYNGNLYFIRNACVTSRWNFACTTTGCTDDPVCPAGEETPQLWKCEPGGDGFCDSGEWTMVAENGATARTNFGDVNNTHITFLKANGGFLYVGLNNTNGAQLWRTGATNPAVESDFSQVGAAGFGDPVNVQQFFSGVSVQQGLFYYLYISAGRSATPVRIYTQRNN